MTRESTAAQPSATIAGRSRRYILVMLTLVYVINYLDRNILNILLPAIKAEFRLTTPISAFWQEQSLPFSTQRSASLWRGLQIAPTGATSLPTP